MARMGFGELNRRGRVLTLRHVLRCASAGLALAVLAELPAVQAETTVPETKLTETKVFAVSWFYNATYYGGPQDCPDGLNEKAIEFYRRELIQGGRSAAEVDDIFKDFPGNGTGKRPWQPIVVTRGNGHDNVYAYPDSMPDTVKLKTIHSKYAYGFNLDGKGADSPNSFEDPDTHEKGVNNEVYRVTGCIRTYVGGPPPYRPTWPSQNWEILRDQAPAWLISVIPSKDAPDRVPQRVTVRIDRAVERVTRDANADIRANMTYRVDPDPRTHNVLQGKIENGMIVTDPADIRIVADVRLNPDIRFSHARLRFVITPEGNLNGILGGYEPWYPIYTVLAIRAHQFEFPTSIDLPMLYHGLKDRADADPDPVTGQNRQISNAYILEAVPALIAPGSAAQR